MEGDYASVRFSLAKSGVNECYRDLTPVETIAGGLDYFRFGDNSPEAAWRATESGTAL